MFLRLGPCPQPPALCTLPCALAPMSAPDPQPGTLSPDGPNKGHGERDKGNRMRQDESHCTVGPENRAPVSFTQISRGGGIKDPQPATRSVSWPLGPPPGPARRPGPQAMSSQCCLGSIFFLKARKIRERKKMSTCTGKRPDRGAEVPNPVTRYIGGQAPKSQLR